MKKVSVSTADLNRVQDGGSLTITRDFSEFAKDEDVEVSDGLKFVKLKVLKVIPYGRSQANVEIGSEAA